jgi:hypothetical protein
MTAPSGWADEDPGLDLQPRHLADLRRSGLSDDTIAAAGIRSLTAAEVKAAIGMDAGPGMGIPYSTALCADGSRYMRVKPDKPLKMVNGKGASYLTRPGETNRLYITAGLPDDWRANTALPLGIVEGEKKSLKATEEGFSCLGMIGPWGWVKKGKRPVSDLSHIAWRGRKVTVIADSDMAANETGREGFEALVEHLRSRGAVASLLLIPEAGEEKQGLDDFLVANGAEGFAELLAKQDDQTPVLRVVEIRDFLADTTPPPPDVIAGVSKAGTILSIFGPAESGKSHLGIDLCLSVAAGRDWLGRFPCNKGSSVYVEQERAEFLVRDRMRLLAEGVDFPDDADPVYIMPMQSLKLDTPEAQESFRQQIVDLGPRLVVIDTAIAVAGTVQFLDPGAVRPWLEWWRRLAVEIAGVVCLICHVPKWLNKEPQLASLFGSEDFGASLDYGFATMPVDAGKHVFRLTCVKNTWGLDRPDLTFEIMPNPDGGIVLAASAPVYGGLRTIIMENMSEDWIGGAAFARLTEKAGFNPRSARKVLDGLVAEGLVDHQPDPKNKRWHQFRLPAEGGV